MLKKTTFLIFQEKKIKTVLSLFIIIIVFSGCDTTIPFLNKGQEEHHEEEYIQGQLDHFLEQAFQLYEKGLYGRALTFYKKALVLDPENQLIVYRIKEIRKWVPFIKQRDSSYNKVIDNLKRENKDNLEKVEEDRKQIELELGDIKKESLININKARALDLLHAASLALVEHDFAKARVNAKQAMMMYPDISGVAEFLDKVSQAENEWLIVSKLVEVDLNLKYTKNSQDNKTKDVDTTVKENIKETPDIFKKHEEAILERSAKSEVQEIIEDEFKFKDISKFNKKAKMAEMEHLRLQSLRVYEKVINDYENDIKNKTLVIDDYSKEELESFFEGIAGSYYWVGKYYFKEKELDKAIPYFKAITDNSSFNEFSYYFSSLFFMGSILFEKGELKEAYTTFEKVVDGVASIDLEKAQDSYDEQSEDIEENILYLFKESYKKWAEIRRVNKDFNLNIVLQLYEDLIDKFSWNADVVDEIKLLIADTYIAKSECESALKIYKDLLEKGRKSKVYDSAYFGEAKVLCSLGKYEDSRSVLRDIFINDPLNTKKIDSAYFFGETFYLEKDYSQAIIYIKKAYDEFPEFADRIHYMIILGQSYMNLGLGESTISIFKTVLDTLEKSKEKGENKIPEYAAEIYYEIAKAYNSRSMYNKARKSILKLGIAFPESDFAVKGRYLLADIYFNNEKYVLSDKQNKIAYVLDNDKNSLNAIISKYKRGIALRHIPKHDFLLKYYKDAFAYNDLGRENWDLEDNSKRAEYLKYYYKMLFEYGDFLIEKQKYNDAIKLLKRVSSEYPEGKNRIWSLYLIAKAYELTERKEDAINAYKILLAEDKEDFWVQQGQFNLNNLMWNDKHKNDALAIGGSDSGKAAN